MRSPASEQKEREWGRGRGGAGETGKHRACRLMKTNSICSQLEMKCALEVLRALCVTVYMWLCVILCVRPCGSVATMHVWVGVTVSDLVEAEVGMWVNAGIWL